MKFSNDLNEFLTLNNLIGLDLETWEQVAEFFDIPLLAGISEQESVKIFLSDNEQREQFKAPLQPQNNDLASILAGALNPYLNAQKLDKNEIIELIKEHAPQRIAETKIFINDISKGSLEGRQHCNFETVLKIVAAGCNPYLFGPAGTGKTQLAENVAIALNKNFFSISVCAQSTKSDLLGFMNAGGNYTKTLFREAYENGGVFLLDEIDNGNPNVLAVLNSALANGYCAFPDQMIKRNENFTLVASANTFGTGGTREYVGRNQLDAATLNRFIQVEINYDQDLEVEIFGNMALKVQAIREKLKSERVIISMRNISNACKLLTVGYTEDQALQIAVINTIPENLRSRI